MTPNPGLQIVPRRDRAPLDNVHNYADAMAVLSGTLLFGDSLQIMAVRYLEMFERALKVLNIQGYQATCWCCSGYGIVACNNEQCGHSHPCSSCAGAGRQAATKELMQTFSRDQLRVVAAEAEELLEATA